jgi:hypothetical protein
MEVHTHTPWRSTHTHTLIICRVRTPKILLNLISWSANSRSPKILLNFISWSANSRTPKFFWILSLGVPTQEAQKFFWIWSLGVPTQETQNSSEFYILEYQLKKPKILLNFISWSANSRTPKFFWILSLGVPTQKTHFAILVLVVLHTAQHTEYIYILKQSNKLWEVTTTQAFSSVAYMFSIHLVLIL